tara:strand:- start:55 stop:345 length:291 start_codon:yes stop_codon:yes gene_type:complete
MNKGLFQIVKSPYLTEKVSDLKQESNQYAFKVDVSATKREIKKAVESYFSVKVKNVCTVNVKGKTKRSRYRIKKRSDWKKAYVSLSDGQTIDVGLE